MAKHASDLLARPAPVAVARVGLALLDDARAAAGRLHDPDDPEALHDFRVALRRLRTLLRSFRQELGDSVSKKLQRRLRDETRATSGGRDAEVQLAWVREHRGELGPRPRPGLPWFVARLETRRDEAYAEIRQEVGRTFRPLERRVRQALTASLVDLAPRRSPFGVAAARLIREHAAPLEQELAAAHSTRDADAVHTARIAVKRLRYVLEPLATEVPQAPAIVDHLKRLQDLLGELHDGHVLAAELGEAVAVAAAERARRLHQLAVRPPERGGTRRPRRPKPSSTGLLALARLATEWQERLFERLGVDWLARALAVLLQDVVALADALTPAQRAAPLLPAPSRPTRRKRPALATRARPPRATTSPPGG